MQTFARVSIDVLRYQYTAKLTIFFKNCLQLLQIDLIAIFQKFKKKAVDSKQSYKRKTAFLCTNFLYSLELSIGLRDILPRMYNCQTFVFGSRRTVHSVLRFQIADLQVNTIYFKEVAQKLVPICNCEESTTVENVRGKRFPSRCLRVPFCCLQHLQAKVFEKQKGRNRSKDYFLLSSSSSSFYSHLFNYNITKMRDGKEVKNRADYTLN